DPPRQERFPPPSRALKDSGPGGGGQGEAHKRHRFAEAENEGAQRGGENPLKDQGHPKNAEQYGKGPSPPERMAGRFFFIGFGLPSGNRFGRERKEQEDSDQGQASKEQRRVPKADPGTQQAARRHPDEASQTVQTVVGPRHFPPIPPACGADDRIVSTDPQKRPCHPPERAEEQPGRQT